MELSSRSEVFRYESAPHYLYTLWISSPLSFSLLSFSFWIWESENRGKRKENRKKERRMVIFPDFFLFFPSFIHLEVNCWKRATLSLHALNFLCSLFLSSFSLFFRISESKNRGKKKGTGVKGRRRIIFRPRFHTFFHFSLRSSISKWTFYHESAPYYLYTLWISSPLSFSFLSFFLFFSELRIEFFPSFIHLEILYWKRAIFELSKFPLLSLLSFSFSLFGFENRKIEKKKRTGAKGWISSPFSFSFLSFFLFLSDLRIEFFSSFYLEIHYWKRVIFELSKFLFLFSFSFSEFENRKIENRRGRMNFFSSFFSLFGFKNRKIEKKTENRRERVNFFSSLFLFSDLRIKKSWKKREHSSKGRISSPLSFSLLSFRI